MSPTHSLSDYRAMILDLLAAIDQEIEQRQDGGNNEDYAALQVLSDRGHAIAKAPAPAPTGHIAITHCDTANFSFMAVAATEDAAGDVLWQGVNRHTELTGAPDSAADIIDGYGTDTVTVPGTCTQAMCFRDGVPIYPANTEADQ